MAASTCFSSPKMVHTIGAQCGQRWRAAAITSSPLPSGRPRSTSSTSGMSVQGGTSAASASARVATAHSKRMSGAAFSVATSAMRVAASSSTTATRIGASAAATGEGSETVMVDIITHLGFEVM